MIYQARYNLGMNYSSVYSGFGIDCDGSGHCPAVQITGGICVVDAWGERDSFHLQSAHRALSLPVRRDQCRSVPIRKYYAKSLFSRLRNGPYVCRAACGVISIQRHSPADFTLKLWIQSKFKGGSSENRGGGFCHVRRHEAVRKPLKGSKWERGAPKTKKTEHFYDTRLLWLYFIIMNEWNIIQWKA